MALDYLPDSARVWIFTADRSLDSNEIEGLNVELTEFVSAWKAHGKPLSAGFEIAFNTVVVVAVDEAAEVPSGCSIDKVFRLMQDFGQTNQIDFFQRTKILKPVGNGVQILTRHEAQKAFETGTLTSADMVINTLPNNLSFWKKNALIPFSQSWLYPQINTKKTV